MSTLYPTAKDDNTTLPNPSGTNTQNNPDHGQLHTSENAAIIAVESKLGTGATTPTANTLLLGTGTGTSAWSQATSAQLAASVSDETGSGSLVFATTPTLVTPKVDTINESTLNNGVTVGGVGLKAGAVTGTLASTNAVTTANITSANVTAAKLQFGTVYRRQGGTTGAASWDTAGTTNTDVSSTAVFIQVGSVLTSAGIANVTFPVTFSQLPIVTVTVSSANVSNVFARITGKLATGFTVSIFNTSNTAGGAETINWIAIGQ